MPSLEVEWAAQAVDDLRGVFHYIEAAGNPLAALRYTNDVANRAERLADFPRVGRSREDILTGLRTLPFRSALIVYQVSDNSIRLLRILHQQRDIESILKSLDSAPD